MSPCHNIEPSLVARDSSRLLSVKPNEWMHLSPFYTRMHGEWHRYAKSTSQFHWRFLLVIDVRGFQVNPLCRHDITSPFPPSGNGGYVRNLDVSCGAFKSNHRCYELCLKKYVYHLLTGVPHMELDTFNKRKYLALIIHSSLISGYLYDNVLFKSFTLD